MGRRASAQPTRAQGRPTVVQRMPESALVRSGLGVLRLAWPSLYHQPVPEGSRLQLAEVWAIGAGLSAIGRVVQRAEATALLVVGAAGALECVPCTVSPVQPLSRTPIVDPGHLGPPAGGPGGTSFPGELRLAEVG